MWEAATICPRPSDLDLLTLKVVSESRVTWATSVPTLVFLGISVLDLGPNVIAALQYNTICTHVHYKQKLWVGHHYQTDRRQTASSLNVPPRGRGRNNSRQAHTVVENSNIKQRHLASDAKRESRTRIRAHSTEYGQIAQKLADNTASV